ncbi:T9SS type A sorting domain-containing protein [Kordia sp. YSTF-M3]|uniref:T9SS type A sorting domain-containing protein n=2 Tax=Kordia aestuariivivens TaxID=2759037 RepID=A0ABR7QEP1_9FLAO|nr:T9SS type A sorting domain-containing protein [Kordia aestuariivivens]
MNRAAAFALNGDDLYVSENQSGRVFKMGVTGTTYIMTDVAIGINDPYGLAVNNTDLYIAESGSNKISKVNITPLSVDEYILKPRIQLYPNPATNYIQLSNFPKNENYTIYNISGAKIKRSNISNNEKIDIQNLTNGLYFLKFDNGITLKFIKE